MIAAKWKLIIIRDDDGNELQRIELDENQKQNQFKKRNKRRTFKNRNPVDACTVAAPSPPLSFHFNIESSIIFSRESTLVKPSFMPTLNLSMPVEPNFIIPSNIDEISDEFGLLNLRSRNETNSEISFDDMSIEECFMAGLNQDYDNVPILFEDFENFDKTEV